MENTNEKKIMTPADCVTLADYYEYKRQVSREWYQRNREHKKAYQREYYRRKKMEDAKKSSNKDQPEDNNILEA